MTGGWEIPQAESGAGLDVDGGVPQGVPEQLKLGLVEYRNPVEVHEPEPDEGRQYAST
ncbi:hypothetical protein KC851_03375 [Candidatus Kaiserbacteria bacterium]|nr:hypothetical protein [Candidatus Kaiserbacteria bacterium]